MKKLLQILCLIFLVFGLTVSVNALTFTLNGTEVGGIFSVDSGVPDVYIGSTIAPGLTLVDFYNPEHQDSTENVNKIIDEYNAADSDSLSPAYFSYKNESPPTDGSISVTPGTEYISLKWGAFESANGGGWFLWYVGDLNFDQIDFEHGSLSQGLSHYTEWSSTPVPEPATMMLFGLGLLGLAGVSRKKLVK
jgi:hypothetical protein